MQREQDKDSGEERPRKGPRATEKRCKDETDDNRPKLQKGNDGSRENKPGEWIRGSGGRNDDRTDKGP